MNFSHIWCRCELRIFHNLHDIVFYYREGYESNEGIQLSNESLFDDVNSNCNIVEDNDLVGVLLH